MDRGAGPTPDDRVPAPVRRVRARTRDQGGAGGPTAGLDVGPPTAGPGDAAVHDPADDLAGALAVWQAALAAEGRRPSRAATDELTGRLAAPDALLVVTGEPVVGFALGGWPAGSAGVLQLTLLVVHPARRRDGIGTALAEGLADAGYPMGARRLVAAPVELSARAFLLACGLEAQEPGPDRPNADGPDPDGPNADPSGSSATLWAAELDPPTTDLIVARQGLRLGQLLKLAGLVRTGAEAKALLEDSRVSVNGQVELRRGRQLALGDTVVAGDRAVHLVAG